MGRFGSGAVGIIVGISSQYVRCVHFQFKPLPQQASARLVWGYRPGELRPKKALPEPDSSLTIKLRRGRGPEKRAVVGFLSKFRILDSTSGKLAPTSMIPDLNSLVSHVTGAIGRYGRKMPDAEPERRQRFLRFAKAFIPRKFIPPDLKSVTTRRLFEDWLAHTPYSAKRKIQLRALREEIEQVGLKPAQMKEIVDSLAFTKWEGWDEPKWPRMINSPSDYTKVILGPIIHAIDEALYDKGNVDSYFVKGKDPRDRAPMLLELFGNDPVIETDFTSMEAHHYAEFNEAVAFGFAHMLRAMPHRNMEKRLIMRMIRGSNRSFFSTCTVSVDQKLMSGVLWTSSANGLLDLLLLLFLKFDVPGRSLEETVDLALQERRLRVEGDDGIMAASAAQAADMEISAAKLGLILKPVAHRNFTEASFCSTVCSADELIILPDPCKVLRKFFVLPPGLRLCRESAHFSQMRAKALSYAYLYHDTPVVGELAHRVCELTRSYDISKVLRTGWNHDDYISQALSDRDRWVKKRPAVSMTSRLLVEKRFGLTVNEQLLMESQIRESGPTFNVMVDQLRSSWDDQYQDTYVSDLEPIITTLPFLPTNVRGILEDGLKGKSRKYVINFSRREDWAGQAVNPLADDGS